MQPAEHVQPPQSQGRPVPPVAHVNSGQSESSLKVTHEPTLSQSDRFRTQVLAPLEAIRGLDPSDASSPKMRDFKTRFEDSGVRAVAWEHIGAFGVSSALTLAQQQILAASLMPYVVTDQERSWNALIKMAQHAASSQDMTTYELAGISALAANLPDATIEHLAVPFAGYTTHNAEQVPALSPWIKLFVERGSEATCAILIDTLIQRLWAAQFSSYDHILSVLCQSRQPLALRALQNGSNPPIFDDTFATPPIPFLIGQSIVDTARFMPLVILGTYVFGGVEMVTSPTMPLISLALGSAFTWIVRRPFLKESARELVALQKEFIQSAHYDYFLGRLYEKLCALPSDRTDVATILDTMDNHPLFQSKRAEWRAMRSQSTGDA